jgi:hypothetical protein
MVLGFLITWLWVECSRRHLIILGLLNFLKNISCIFHRSYGSWVAWYFPVVQSCATLLNGGALRSSTNGTTICWFSDLGCRFVFPYLLFCHVCTMWRTVSFLLLVFFFNIQSIDFSSNCESQKVVRVVLGWQVCKSIFLYVCGHRRQWVGDSWDNPPLCRDTWSLLWQCKSTLFA